MKIKEAVDEVRGGVIRGVRGVGCASIIMTDGRVYGLVDEYRDLVERFDGELSERVPYDDIAGEVDHVDWTVDELGGLYF